MKEMKLKNDIPKDTIEFKVAVLCVMPEHDWYT